jgi:hypothetical protein
MVRMVRLGAGLINARIIGPGGKERPHRIAAGALENLVFGVGGTGLEPVTSTMST